MVHATDGDGDTSDVAMPNKSEDFTISLTKLSNKSNRGYRESHFE